MMGFEEAVKQVEVEAGIHDTDYETRCNLRPCVVHQINPVERDLLSACDP